MKNQKHIKKDIKIIEKLVKKELEEQEIKF